MDQKNSVVTRHFLSRPIYSGLFQESRVVQAPVEEETKTEKTTEESDKNQTSIGSLKHYPKTTVNNGRESSKVSSFSKAVKTHKAPASGGPSSFSIANSPMKSPYKRYGTTSQSSGAIKSTFPFKGDLIRVWSQRESMKEKQHQKKAKTKKKFPNSFWFLRIQACFNNKSKGNALLRELKLK